jgi:hypothetical protein
MYAIGTICTIVGPKVVRGIVKASQEPRQSHSNQENPGDNCGRLLATQIADKVGHSIEIGVAQKARDVLEPGGSIMDVARHPRKMLFEVAGRVMASRRQAANSLGGGPPLLCSGFARLRRG